eukprot:11215417-Lingulodinium_polyedra.AAC.1
MADHSTCFPKGVLVENIQESPGTDAGDRVVVPLLHKSVRATCAFVIVRPGGHHVAKLGHRNGLLQH